MTVVLWLGSPFVLDAETPWALAGIAFGVMAVILTLRPPLALDAEAFSCAE